MSDFNRHANNYEKILDDSMSEFGGAGEYYADNKASFIERVLGSRDCQKLLDYGCGIGMNARAIASRLPNLNIVGYDPSLQSIDVAKQSAESQMINYVSDIAHVESDFNLIVVSNVLHHIIPKNRNETIEKISKKMFVGGRVIIFEHNPSNPLTRKVVDKCPFDHDAILLKKEEVELLLISQGFRIEKSVYITFFPKMLSFFRWMEPLLEWCPLGGQYSVIAVKENDK